MTKKPMLIASENGSYVKFTGAIICCAAEGLVKNASFTIYSDCLVFDRGTWVSGIVSRGSFTHCAWLNGTLRSGWFVDGVWDNGVFLSGMYCHSQWRDGIFDGGVFWGGEWKNGTWKDGTWHDGIWTGGKWIYGYDKNDKPHKRSPNKWKMYSVAINK